MNPSTEIYVLSFERYEMLRCCLASVCGFNTGVGPVHVIDDASKDPRVPKLLDAYAEADLLTWEATPERRSVGWTRRVAFDRFLEGEAGQLVQVEGDMLLSPAAIARLVSAYTYLRLFDEPVGWLCTHNHDWCHPIHDRFHLNVGFMHDYEFAVVSSGSEPFWTTSRDVVEEHHRLVMPHDNSLVGYIKAVSETSRAAVILEPEIQVQHLGAIRSFYYPDFAPGHVTYFNSDGRPRQPFPWFEIDFDKYAADYPACYQRISDVLIDRSPVPLPTA